MGRAATPLGQQQLGINYVGRNPMKTIMLSCNAGALHLGPWHVPGHGGADLALPPGRAFMPLSARVDDFGKLSSVAAVPSFSWSTTLLPLGANCMRA